ncbi:GDSL-type esterase/lipase family protein [Streptomyces sp. NBC_00873]|uniref:GDSL-type esterase/lipase family protein n=1 Tax=unclassified Streptomyces TaxID=2593676 RepID=UPI00386C9BC0|nr:GDSL-type esterase/lipase family protein [Streptomyces sp. NBC_00873]WTA42735.1 GDSL-type esterase/lipase family protein [Streptomyces sp. NBC_00842]
MTWLDPDAFLRGVAWRDGVCPVRADPADLARLPWDTAERALLPTGVRLEFVAPGARAVEIRYRAAARGAADGQAGLFALWQGGQCVAEVLAAPAEEAVTVIGLPPGEGPFTVHPPETLGPAILGLRAVGGTLLPAPVRPRWVVHGDSITEGWWSTRPAHAWPAVAGRALGLDPVNLGYAGSARGELCVAEQIAGLPADVLTLAFGTNCWSSVPFSAPLLYETVRAFVALVRAGHPGTPILLVSPLLRPDAEESPNALGATLSELRTALERAGASLVRAGDSRLSVLPGREVLGPEHLVDGLHPDDSGHALLAAAVADALTPYVPLATENARAATAARAQSS